MGKEDILHEHRELASQILELDMLKGGRTIVKAAKYISKDTKKLVKKVKGPKKGAISKIIHKLRVNKAKKAGKFVNTKKGKIKLAKIYAKDPKAAAAMKKYVAIKDKSTKPLTKKKAIRKWIKKRSTKKLAKQQELN